jgi:hypothetical protein
MTVVTLEDLATAIANRVKINVEAAMGDANFVMDLFGYEDRIIDNVLEPEDRQLFYILEEEGMLTTEREETTIYDGRTWRTHYWFLNKDTILGYKEGRETGETGERDQDVEEVYDDIPDEMWYIE